MEHRRFLNETSIYDPNLRAEDGVPNHNQRSDFQEYVVAPLSFMIAILLVIWLMSLSAFAQAGDGRISGTVKDATGALIPNSQVVLVNPASGVKQSTTSGGDGVFTLPSFPWANMSWTST